jgi:hypothetical protein
MAKARKSTARRKLSPPKSRERDAVNIRVVPDISSDPPTYYINYADINHSANEFSLIAIRVPSRFTKEKQAEIIKTKEILIEPVVQLLLPPAVMAGLGEAIATQLKKYEERFGKIKRGA